MFFISGLITIIVSVVLILWILKLKKDNPFPKYTVPKVLLGGWLSFVISGALTIALMLGYAVAKIGPENFITVWNDARSGNESSAVQTISSISAPNAWFALLKSILAIGLVEELLKYTTMRLIARKPGTLNNHFDVVLLSALVGTGFQIFENIGYVATGGLVLAILRALMPFHFAFGAIMGYYYGKYIKSGNKKDLCLAIGLPSLIHGLYDFCVLNAADYDFLLPFALVAIVALLAITVLMIIKINKWSKDESMKSAL